MKNLYLVIGPSGCGKTTIVNALREKYGYQVVQSCTTRPRRYPEEGGYHFVSPEEFAKLGKVYAYTQHDGYEYGVSGDELKLGDLFVLNPAGVVSLKEEFQGVKGISVIGLTAPNEVCYARMKHRGDSAEKIQARLELDADLFRNVASLVDVHVDTRGSVEEVCEFIHEWIAFHEKEVSLDVNPEWEALEDKYPEPREEMPDERAREFVNDCFALYEQEGFADRFWSPYGDYKERFGEPFTVVERCTEENCHLDVLPLWNIRFEDGTVIGAYPEEIVPSEMKENGCPYFDVSLEQKVVDASHEAELREGKTDNGKRLAEPELC